MALNNVGLRTQDQIQPEKTKIHHGNTQLRHPRSFQQLKPI